MILGNSAIGGTGLGNFNDPFYNYVTLLLTGANGSNATSNNTFIDSSQYSQTVTRNGDTTQGSFTPYNGNYYSNFLNGSTDYISVPANAAFAFGTGDFTVEAWVYLTATTASRLATTRSPSAGLAGTWSFSLSGTTIGFTEVVAGEPGPSATIPSIVNQWTHVVACRQSGTTRLFVNGAQVASASQTTNFSSTANSLVIGSSPTNENFMAGYISNLRILKGTAVYTSNFTPPTAPLTAIANTSLLTCQSNRLIDTSANNFTITRVGDTRVQAFNPFAFQGLPYAGSINGGSMYFDGNGDWLEIPYNATFNLSTGNWTVECWWYPTVVANQTIVMINYIGGDGYAQARIAPTSGGAFAILSASGATTWINTTAIGSYTTGQWYHLAYVRNGSTFSLFVNGTLAGSYSSASNLQAGTGVSAIGRTSSSISAFNYTTGYISDVRLTKGVAVYTSSFTPPTQPLQPISGTSLLLRGTNAAIFDRKQINDLVAIGDTQLRTAITRYNSTSIFFDGTGDYLSVPTNINFSFGTGDFTIEGWMYLSSNTGAYRVIVNIPHSSGNLTIRFGDSGSYSSYFQVSILTTAAANVYSTNQNQAALLNQWVYFAFTRSSSTCRVFLNGTQQNLGTGTTPVSFPSASFSDSTNIINNSAVGIGDSIGSSIPWIGYLDDLRITTGVARYTSSFTPPTYSPLGF